MLNYWQSLTDREKMLVGMAATLALLTVFYFAVMRPLISYHQDSVRAYTAAVTTYESVRGYAAQLLATQRPESPHGQSGENRQSLRVAISNAARANGVSISRLQPSEDGTLTIWAEGIGSAQLFRWLQTLSDQRGVGPANVLIQKSTSDETLRVQLRFESVS